MTGLRLSFGFRPTRKGAGAPAAPSTIFPRTLLAAAGPSITSASALDHADTTSLVIGMIVDQVAAPAANGDLYAASPAATSIQLLSTNKWRVFLRDAAGTGIGTLSVTGTMPTGSALTTMLFSIDMTQATAAAGVQCYINGSAAAFTATGWTQNGQLGFSRTTARKIPVAATSFIGGLSMLYIQPGSLLDLSVAGNRDKFTRLLIGANGDGVVGGQPAVFIVGYATKLNSASANYGTTSYPTTTANFTTTNGQVWP